LAHQAPPDTVVQSIPVQVLAFEVLRAGAWDIEYIVDYYRRAAHNPGPTLAGQRILYERLHQINLLKPVSCLVGTESWHGYVIFKFSDTNKVVLECPIEGNAIYILSSNWENMVGHTKLDLRARYPAHYTRVKHTGEWLDRIEKALRR
jgi:hypothetical protein